MAWVDCILRNRRALLTFFVPGFALGSILGILITKTQLSHGDEPDLMDDNGDGQPDALFVYQDALIQKMSLDRNFDGIYDFTQGYTNGQADVYFADNNFDKKEDAWGFFVHGRISREHYDSDFNGQKDSELYYSNGLPAQLIVRPNGSTIRRIEMFEYGVKRREEIYDDQARLSKVMQYDAFGAIIRTNL